MSLTDVKQKKDSSTAVQLFHRSLDKFLAKDMKGWTDLCDKEVVAEFPFAPEGSPSKLEGRDALYEYLLSTIANTGIHWLSLQLWVTPDSISDDAAT